MPGVVDARTSPEIGDGFGLARSIDLLELIYVLMKAGSRNCRTFVDLGCGDGVVLRVANIFKIKNIIGIESDAKISQFAKENNPKALVLHCKFQDWESQNLVQSRYVIYSFNPCEFSILLSAINKILGSNDNCKAIILKNINHSLDGIRCSKEFSIFAWRSFKIICFS